MRQCKCADAGACMRVTARKYLYLRTCATHPEVQHAQVPTCTHIRMPPAHPSDAGFRPLLLLIVTKWPTGFLIPIPRIWTRRPLLSFSAAVSC